MQIGFLLFPGTTQLDLTGPYEVLARVPGTQVHLAWKRREPVATENGLAIVPTTTLADCPPLDVLCVPGGPGVNELLTDDEVLAFVRRMAAPARFVTAVCTGALVLGAAGLLEGRRATTHWMSMEFLRPFGAEPVEERVVVDGKVITGGGVTAGIDFGLHVAAEIAGRDAAETIQLEIQYDPQPPFDAGTPEQAPPAIVDAARAQAAARQRYRAAQVAVAAARLRERGGKSSSGT